MPSRYRRRDRGAYQADQLNRRLAEELRNARLSAGLSLRSVAAAAGISPAQLHRMEYARNRAVSLRTLSIVFAVVGMRLSARPYPEGPPLRDAAHARLLSRLTTQLPPTIRMRTEVPLGPSGDLRAWDAELCTGSDTCKLEAETVLQDLQATDRRLALKMRDGSVDRLILLVADTRRNRRVLREFRELITLRYPLGTRSVMRLLRSGRLPDQSGVVVL
jgi:transcriptional regulator with XRE-family HTH domain